MHHQIAITGHCQLLNEEEVRQNIAYSLQYFKEKYNDIVAISALAKGADTIFIQEANKQNIPVRFILPFDLEEYKKDFSEESQKVLEDLINDNNNQYEVVSLLKPENQEERNEAYLAVGKRLVEESDSLLAVWDNQPAAGKGGTGDVVAYASTKSKEIHYIKAIRGENKQDKEQNLLSEYDNKAIILKNDFTKVWAWGLRFAVYAVVFFAIGLNFSENHLPKDYPNHLTHVGVFILACLEVICLFTSAYLLIYRVKPLKNNFLELRRNAEVLRTIKSYKDAGVTLPKIGNSRNLPNQEVLRIEKNAFQNPPTSINLSNAKRILWVLAEDQINYHKTRRIPRLNGYKDRLQFWFGIIKKIFFTAVSIKFLIEFQEFIHYQICIPTHFGLPFLNCIVIILPTIYAALEGVSYFGEYKKNIAISNEIANELKKCQVPMLANSNENEFMQETKRLRQILELENSEWVERLFDFHFGPHL